jgi:UDP-N-acetylmuramoyl-tripeptide--D-alanyl-D-alanine ligase
MVLVMMLLSNIIYVFIEGLFIFKRTAKALLIYGANIVLVSLYILVSPTSGSVNLMFLISPLVLIGLVAVLAPITKYAKEKIIKNATEAVKDHPNLKVIGITGSYGKSSTKTFLIQLLSTKYKVVATSKNINTDIGVAHMILKELKPEHEVFIVEMGAYKIGEIANICKMTPPDVSILTAISPQHISLFGSIENIMQAKGEIFTFMKKGGLAIVNGDNSKCIEMAKKADVKMTSYGIKNTGVEHLITDVSHDGTNLSFRLDGYKIEVEVLGQHQSMNISAAILAAQQIGMTGAEIMEGLKALSAPKAVLSLKEGYKGSVILDDSYNSNPDGFIAAISVAKDRKVDGKKILITMGMIELGKESEEHHREVGQLANQFFDLIVVTRKEAYRPFSKVIADNKLKLIERPQQLIKYLTDTVDQYDLILVENRLYENVLNFLLNK